MSGLDLNEHKGYIQNLITKWNVNENDRQDIYQDFFIYFTKYSHFDNEKGKPTTFISHVFRNFMIEKRLRGKRHTPLDSAIHIEERDGDFLDRELGIYESKPEDYVYLLELLEDIDDTYIKLLTGEETYTTQAEKEGVTRQAVRQRHRYTMDKLINK